MRPTPSLLAATRWDPYITLAAEDAGISPLLLKAVGEGRGGNYQIRDEARLRAAARTWGIEEAGRDVHELAREVADLFLQEFTLQEGKLRSLALAPEPRQGIWDRLDIAPAGIDSTIVEALHRTNMGTDHDYKNLEKGKSPAEKINVLFLSTLSRKATPDELQFMLSEVKQNGNRGYKNVLAALLTTSEFIFVK